MKARRVVALALLAADALNGRVFPGKARATQEVNLSFRVPGRLVTLPVKVGDVVSEGQILAQLDPRDFQVELRNAQAQLAEAKAALILTRDELERAQEAHRRGGVADIELSRRVANRDRAQAQVESLEASVDAAQDALNDTNLEAPFAGAIAATYVENHEDVMAKREILRLLDASHIEMVVEIPEQAISLISYVRDITCEFDPFPGREVPAEIKEIGKEASRTTRTFPVTLIMEQAEDFRVLPGMTGQARGRVELPEGDTAGGIEVPLSAVASFDGTTSYVWVIDETTGNVSRRDVTLGEMTAVGIRVQGLEPGLWVATAGVHYLTEGQQVRILGETPS
jgi:RND family efflux transporter MFP subunit